MDEDQINGVVNNTKGVLHEMEFVRIENEDGDTVHAVLFDATNHPGYDVEFVDSTSGAIWQTQLKATDDASYVDDWIEAHPEGEIQVTDELAAEMGLPSSGLSNEELTARTEDVVDRLVDAGDDDTIWNHLPGLAAVSVALVVWGLWQRHRSGEITLQQFKWMAAKATGMKAGKLALLSVALMTPGLNVVTAAGLLVKLIYSGAEVIRTVAGASEGRGAAAGASRRAVG